MNRAFFNISAFFYFYFSIVGVWVIFLPKMLEVEGYSPSQIGIILSIPPLMRFLTPFFFLKLFELNAKVFRLSLVMMLMTIPLLYLTIHDFWLFSLSNIFFGIAFGFMLPYIENYALGTLQKERYGKSRLWGSIGFTVIALVLARFFDNAIGLHFISVSIIVSVYFAYLISKDDGHFKREAAQKKASFLLHDQIPLWLSIIFMQVSFGAFYSFFTIYETSHGFSLETVSYLWSFGVLCEILLFYFQAHFITFDLLKILKFTVFVTALRWMALYLFPESLMVSFVSQSLHAFSFALYHTATISYLYTLYDDRKLASQFYFGLGFGLGGFLGSFIAGFFYGPYLFLSSALIALGALGFLYLKAPKLPSRQDV